METKKVGIWIRVSTDRQAQGDSPEIHEKRARAYAEAKDWEVVTVYHLEGISGKSVIGQEEAQRMMADVEAGNIDALIFSKLARLARNTKELIQIAEMFEQFHASLISLQESIDTSTASGRLFYTLLSAMAQWEREETVERIRASNRTRRSQGKMAGGVASFGFDIVDSRLVLNEHEAPIRKRMCELFLEHRRYKTVASILNDMGFTSRKGFPFIGKTVRDLLMNTDAKGIHRSNYKGIPTKNNPLGYKPKEEWVFNPCPRIVTDEMWDDVNALIEQKYNENSNKGKMNRRVNLFMGFLYCHNGHKMSIQSKSSNYSCTECKIRIEKQDLEDVFVTRLKSFSQSKRDQYDYQKGTDLLLSNKKEEIKSTKKLLQEVEQKMNQVLELHFQNKIHTKGFEHHYNPLFEQSEKLSETISNLEQELNQITYSNTNIKDIIKHTYSISESWEGLERFERRNIVESITTSIIFDGEQITFKLKQLPPLDPSTLQTGGVSLAKLRAMKLLPNGVRSGTILLPGEVKLI